MASINQLLNEPLKVLLTDILNDQKVQYSEVLSLLNSIVKGGVTDSEFSDLKKIHDLFLGSYETKYLETIYFNTVYHNTGNAKWWGGVKFPADVKVLGDLVANATEDHSTKLKNEWFLGQDLPMPISGGDAATGKTGDYAFDYAFAKGDLFDSGVQGSDITQGQAGSCYFVAALGAIAQIKPELIKNMFTDNGNGTYGVRFFGQSGEAYTTVNLQLPTKKNGSIAFSGNNEESMSGELWVSLAEKAYAQINGQSGVLDRDTQFNSYQAIEGGFAQPFKQIGNLNYDYYMRLNYGLPDKLYSKKVVSKDSNDIKSKIITKLNEGEVGWIATWGKTEDAAGNTNFVSGHAFMLLGYNSSTDKFIIRNPWGDNPGWGWNAEFEASIEDFWNADLDPIIAITDSPVMDQVFTYSLSSNASTEQTAVAEGNNVQIKISRDQIGSSSVVFLSTVADSATQGDFDALSEQVVEFGPHESTKIINIKTYWDTVVESEERFNVNLYLTNSGTNSTVSSSSTSVYVKDGAFVDYDYSLSTNADANNPVSESGEVTFTVLRDDSGEASTVYFRTVLGTADASDYQMLDMQELKFAAYETEKKITVQTYSDSLYDEDTEFFYIGLYKNYSDKLEEYATYSWGYIEEQGTPVSDYDYLLTSSAMVDFIDEGKPVTFTIERSGDGSASTVYVSTLPGTASGLDFDEVAMQPIEFKSYEKSKTITVNTHQDLWADPYEYFYLALYKNIQDGFYDYDSYTWAYITDAVDEGDVIVDDNNEGDVIVDDNNEGDVIVDGSNYSITSSSDEGAVGEGSSIKFTIERSGDVSSFSTVFVSTTDNTAIGGIDFKGIDKQKVEFKANETSKTVTVQTYQDSETEENEYFWFDLYANEVDVQNGGYSAYASGVIIDAVDDNKGVGNTNGLNYVYEITSSSDEGAVREGSPIEFTIERSGDGSSSSTVYFSTTDNTASAESGDFKGIDKQKVEFKANETSKTVTVQTYQDSETEENESFWFDLYTSEVDAKNGMYSYWAEGQISEFSVAGVNDYSYTISSNSTNSSSVSEGESITFTIERSGSGSSSTVYLGTNDSSALVGDDYAGLDAYAVEFSADETSKIVTVETYADSDSEADEYFWVDLYKSYADIQNDKYSAYVSGYISDVTEKPDYSYSISSNSYNGSLVVEGESITFTIDRSGSGSSSTVYLGTNDSSAKAGDDYAGLDAYAVEFAADETSKTVTVETYKDSKSEGDEYFWVDLYENYADIQTYNYSNYVSGYIADEQGADRYSYSISSNSSANNSVVEGESITFTIDRSGSGSSSTVYLGTNDSSALVGIDYAGLDAYAVEFAADETSKTVTVETYVDSDTEGDEYFWVDLYENYADIQTYNYSNYVSGYISDVTGKSGFSYGISGNSNSSSVIEGESITFTIDRSGSGSSSIVYLVSSDGNALAGDDYAGLDAYAVEFAADETSKTVTVETYIDSESEGDEYFWVDLYENKEDIQHSNFIDIASGYISESSTVNDFDYSISSNSSFSNPVTEGGSILLTIDRSGSGSSSTVYLRTTDKSALAGLDYAGSLMQVEFATDETSKTVTVETYQDSEAEGDEYFWVDLFKNYSDIEINNYSEYVSSYILDVI